MCDNTGKGFEKLSKEEKLKAISEMLHKFLSFTNEDEKVELMMSFMPKMMDNRMSMMKKMCIQMMGTDMFGHEKQNTFKENTASCCGESKENCA